MMQTRRALGSLSEPVRVEGNMNEAAAFEQRVRSSLGASIATAQRLADDGAMIATVAKVAAICVAAVKGGNKILLFGNGGSAADAQHIAAELVGRFAFDRPALPALALTVNASCLTAIGNDYGYERVFSRQLEALARSGDVAIGISTSGNSRNVLEAIQAGKKLGLQTIAFTGAGGGHLGKAADHTICVPVSETPRIQECHIMVGHILAELIEYEIFHDQGRVPGS